MDRTSVRSEYCRISGYVCKPHIYTLLAVFAITKIKGMQVLFPCTENRTSDYRCAAVGPAWHGAAVVGRVA